VFDTKDACEKTDIPDGPAHAFRDDHNDVHLVATNSVNRGMVGRSLDSVKRDCRVIYRSPHDTNPSHFQYNNWLFSFYTIDGRRIAALVHSEYDAFEIPGECATPGPVDKLNCWWNTITFAQSVDGGYSFRVPPPPQQSLVASLPYRYVVGNREGAYGYRRPTNILKVGEFYYAMINAWPYKAQKYGPCLIRTPNVFDPSSWRGWDGENFSVHYADPYKDSDLDAQEHVCVPVMPGVVDSLVQDKGTTTFIVSEFAGDRRFGDPGLYVSASSDLIHWSKPTLVAKTSDMAAADGPGNWKYDYTSLLDPTTDDRSFSTISEKPYVYYVRLDKNHGPYTRVLFRRRIELYFGG
jgi:hypothetical protein